MPALQWYFDYISPFAYLQFHRLRQFDGTVDIELKPLLFAGLLDHWGQKGPAEIPTKRLWTYRHAQWLGAEMGLPLRVPRNHPFNPIRALRLTIALGGDSQTIEKIFAAIWADGALPDNESGWQAISAAVGLDVPAADALVSAPAVKQQLMTNGEDAIGAKVFGVPTAVYNGELFWGVDSTDFLAAFIADPGLFTKPEMAAISAVIPSAERPGSKT